MTLFPSREVLTVTGLTRQVQDVLEAAFDQLWVEGEISNLRRPASGHLYFTLKDEESQVRAVLFRPVARSLRFDPEDGMRIVCRARINVYKPRGEYQLILDYAEPRGAGALQVAFEQLKARLQAEGLFDPGHKKPLPFLPSRIGVVTSPSGAVIRDILNITKRRFPSVNVLVAPVRVQGVEAPGEIVDALRLLNETPGVDVIIVARGGGSLEDLMAFNDEGVARAIFASRIPVVSAVGHEIDFTIADFVADLRAPTPSAAAEMVIATEEAFVERIDGASRRLADLLRYGLRDRRGEVDGLARNRIFQNFQVRLANLARRVDDLETRGRNVLRAERQALAEQKGAARLAAERLANVLVRTVGEGRSAWERLTASLNALSPLGVVKKGYAIVWKEGGLRLAGRIEDVEPGETVTVSYFKGEFGARVETVDRKKRLESRFLKEGP